MDWSVNWDATDCWSFLNAYRTAFGNGVAPTTTTTMEPTSTSTTSSSAAPTTTTTTTSSAPAPTPTSFLPPVYQGAYLKTWSGGWTWDGIQSMYKPLYNVADVTYITFFQTTPNGLDCPAQSPCTSVWSSQHQAEVPAAVAYNYATSQAFQATGMRTLLALGGWSYRDDFAFLATMTPDQLRAWSQKVKTVVDKFGAHGIDIDYEAETRAQWENEMVKTNILHYLREAMPAPYIITLTIGGLAAAYGTPQQIQAAFSPPLSTAYSMAGVALPLIKQNWNDIDRVQLMTYDGEPNMDPRTCTKLAQEAFISFGYSAKDAAQKVLMGAELGEQFGACNGNNQGWCDQDLTDVTAMAQDVKSNNYGGLFYWSNVDADTSRTYYTTTYNTLFN